MERGKTVSIKLNAVELWELINNFGQSYKADLPENALADKIMAKLNYAYEKANSK